MPTGGRKKLDDVLDACDCETEHEGVPRRQPKQIAAKDDDEAKNEAGKSDEQEISGKCAGESGAGDFLPEPPPDEKICDSYIGYKRAVEAALDTSMMYMYVIERLKTLRNNNEEAFKLLDRVPFTQNIIVWRSTSKKSERESRRLRLAADGLMRKSEYRAALVKYNGSVLTAPPSSPCLAQAYAGRARALFYLRDYRGCMENVDAAMNTHSTADPEESETLAKMRNEAKKRLEKDGLLDLPLGEDDTEAAESQATAAATVEPARASNMYNIFNKKAEIQTLFELGRHLVSTADIAPGEIIAEESPVSLVLYPRSWEDHCQRCLRRVIKPFPCRKCSSQKSLGSIAQERSDDAGLREQGLIVELLFPFHDFPKVTYCNEACHTGDKDVHELECHMMHNLYGENETDFRIHMVYRLLRQIPVSIMLSDDSRDALTAYNPLRQIEAGQQDLDPRLAVLLHTYGLKATQTASQGAKWLLDQVIRARYILALLAREKPDEFDTLPPGDYAFLGTVVLKILRGIESNYYSYNIIPILPTGEADDKVAIGAALAASLTFINHACTANACVVWSKGRAKLIALRAIQPDEEVAITYDDVALTGKSWEQRAAQIKARWGFECLCMWCEANMHDPADLILDESNPVSFQCPECQYLPIRGYRDACPNCRTDLRKACFDILNASTGLARCIDAIKNRHEYTTSRLEIQRHLKSLKEFIWLPCQALGLLAQSLVAHRFCLELLYGEKEPSTTLTR